MALLCLRFDDLLLTRSSVVDMKERNFFLPSMPVNRKPSMLSVLLDMRVLLPVMNLVVFFPVTNFNLLRWKEPGNMLNLIRISFCYFLLNIFCCHAFNSTLLIKRELESSRRLLATLPWLSLLSRLLISLETKINIYSLSEESLGGIQ